jgi:hypothetical protein
MNIRNLLMTFILSIFGIALTPTIQEQVTNITGTGGNNLTGSAKSLMELTPMLWVTGIMGINLAMIYLSFRAKS